ncbi:MAG: hypothetical protein ACLRVU_01460 [Beduini sp.]|uniref:hypothetical protein n=1 Tax=Beduini sp. TaxID=1922300 RepID=UPI0039A280F2
MCQSTCFYLCEKTGIHVIGCRYGKLTPMRHNFIGINPLEQILSLKVITAFTSHVYILDILFAYLLYKNLQ